MRTLEAFLARPPLASAIMNTTLCGISNIHCPLLCGVGREWRVTVSQVSVSGAAFECLSGPSIPSFPLRFLLHIPVCLASTKVFRMGSIGQWSALSQKCIDIQRESLPAQWALPVDKLATKSGEDITSLPKTSGILSDLELQITEQDAEGIIHKYLSGDWTVRQVTTAFLKRATIGQQMASSGL